MALSLAMAALAAWHPFSLGGATVGARRTVWPSPFRMAVDSAAEWDEVTVRMITSDPSRVAALLAGDVVHGCELVEETAVGAR